MSERLDLAALLADPVRAAEVPAEDRHAVLDALPYTRSAWRLVRRLAVKALRLVSVATGRVRDAFTAWSTPSRKAEAGDQRPAGGAGNVKEEQMQETKAEHDAAVAVRRDFILRVAALTLDAYDAQLAAGSPPGGVLLAYDLRDPWARDQRALLLATHGRSADMPSGACAATVLYVDDDDGQAGTLLADAYLLVAQGRALLTERPAPGGVRAVFFSGGGVGLGVLEVHGGVGEDFEP